MSSGAFSLFALMLIVRLSLAKFVASTTVFWGVTEGEEGVFPCFTSDINARNSRKVSRGLRTAGQNDIGSVRYKIPRLSSKTDPSPPQMFVDPSNPNSFGRNFEGIFKIGRIAPHKTGF